MDRIRAAVSGFRHGHIISMVKELRDHPDIEVVAASEEAPELCADIIEGAGLSITHNNLSEMIGGADFDVLVLGDVYAKRGGQAIEALKAGKHLFSDKPLCTSQAEIARIKELSSEKNLSVIVALTLRYSVAIQTAKKIIADGVIGEVTNVIVTGHHVLMFRSGRPAWYFEEGMHGGTINDLMVHGIDSVAWITGLRFKSVLAAIAGHFEPAEAPFFQDVAKGFFELENGAGVFIDSSYKAPAGHPSGWEFSIWGTGGSLCFRTSGKISVKQNNKAESLVEPELFSRSALVDDLAAEIRGESGPRRVLTTGECLTAASNAAAAQEAAENREFGVSLQSAATF